MAFYNDRREAMRAFFSNDDWFESFLKTLPNGDEVDIWRKRRTNFFNNQMSLGLMGKCIKEIGGVTFEEVHLPTEFIPKTKER